ncbi:MAG TPA: hypothetical protein VM580_29170 [Labilithrix sp.]|nr:hypothetical protein [Labilithrix sp.]
MRVILAPVAAALAAAHLVFACVGSDPALSGLGSGDAGGSDASTGEATADAGTDASVDAAPCDRTKPFGQPVAAPGVNDPGGGDDRSFRLTADGLYGIVDSKRGDGGTFRPYEVSRASTADAFSNPTLLTTLTSVPQFSSYGGYPVLTPDGLGVYLIVATSGTGPDVWQATRSSRAGFFENLGLVAALSSTGVESAPWLLRDGSQVFFSRIDQGSGTSYLAVADIQGGAFANVRAVDGFSVQDENDRPVVSDDGLTIYFSSPKVAETAGTNIWRAQRSSKTSAFGAPELVTELNSELDDEPSWLSPDECTIYFASNRPGSTGGFDVFVATRPK